MIVGAVTNNVAMGDRFEYRCGAAMYESEYRTQRTIRESISAADGLVKRARKGSRDTVSNDSSIRDVY